MSVTAVPLRPLAKGSVAKLWIGLAVLVALALALAWWGTSRHRYARTASGLQYQVIKEGEGPTPGEKDVAFVTYSGRLPNGTVFDSNVGQQPTPFPVAEGGTVKGFSEGLRMMRKGGIYRLRIPPHLAYGPQGKPPAIPSNTTLEFDVALQGFLPEADLRRLMQQQMMMQQTQQGGAPGAPAQGSPPQGTPQQ